LRSPRTPWAVPLPRPVRPPSASFRCDVLIVGAGITGALMAERLTRQGREVVLIDHESPGQGSTAASTAMLLSEIDRSLTELTQLYGLEHAARCYQASFEAVNGLQRLVARYGLLLPDAAGTFDSTHDGLPLIGAVPGTKNLFAAYGYGGNGITFSYLAAELIGVLVAGHTSPLLDDFAIDRSAP
jgi:glycine/D-amino acid oxidase-like deaminating enzyme